MNLLIQIVLDSATRYYAIRDTYVSGKSYYYRGDLIDEFDLSESLPNLFYGVEESESVTIQLADSREDSWYDIIAAEEIRGRQVIVLDEDETFIASGKINGYVLDVGIELSVELRNHDIFETLIPQHKVTTDTFTETALDLGSPIPIVFGRAKNVPLANVQNYKTSPAQSTGSTSGTALYDSTNPFTASDVGRYVKNQYDLSGKASTFSRIVAYVDAGHVTLADSIMTVGDYYSVHAYDYLVGYGTVENLWVDHAHGYGVKRDGVLVKTADYTFDDGTGSPYNHGYSGYATVRFWEEQVDFGGRYYPMHADVKGLELGGSEADRNFANCIKALLNNSTYGLNESVDSTSFTTAETALSTTYFMCDGYIYEQRTARDILNDLLLPCRSRLSMGSDGEWEITVDGTGSSVATFGDNDGYYNNCTVEAVGADDSDSALKKVSVVYDVSTFEISLDVRTDFGVDRSYELPFVVELVTAKKCLSYLYGRAYYADKKLTMVTDSDAISLSPGDVITITSSRHNLSSATYRILSITKGLTNFSLECEAYNASIFDDQSISDPTDDTSVLEAYDLRSIETGYIGGMLITGTAIATEDGLVGMSSAISGGTDWRFWAGHATPGSAPFRVDSAGNLYATSATVTGTITATLGSIGGFTIGATTLTATRLVLTSGDANVANIAVGTSTYCAGINSANATGDIAFWAGSSFANRATAPFRVTAGGAITSTSGNFGGWTVDSNSIYSGGKTISGYSASGITLYYAAGYGSIHAAKFYISSGGVLYCYGAHFAGEVDYGYDITCNAGADIIMAGGTAGNPSLIHIRDGSATSGEAGIRFEDTDYPDTYYFLLGK